ncbi:TPA: glycosyltransferase family 32 protein [Vibrio cholerae]
MSIPKKIHYCWFGGNDLPDLANYCIDSWKKHCPDYEIIRWDESNSDLNSCNFVRQAYLAKKWAFVSDYIRLKIIEEHGGIYLDIDVELLKSLDPLLEHQGFMGFEQSKPYCVATGLGFGAIPHHPVIKSLIENYEATNFVRNDGCFDMIPCPQRDTLILQSFGLKQDNSRQCIDGIEIYPFHFFSPMSISGINAINSESISIHHFNGSWLDELSHNLIMNKRNAIVRHGKFLGLLLGCHYTFSYNLKKFGLIRGGRVILFGFLSKITNKFFKKD